MVTKLTKEADALLEESHPDFVRIDVTEQQLSFKAKTLKDLNSKTLKICFESVTEKIEESSQFLTRYFSLKENRYCEGPAPCFVQ